MFSAFPFDCSFFQLEATESSLIFGEAMPTNCTTQTELWDLLNETENDLTSPYEILSDLLLEGDLVGLFWSHKCQVQQKMRGVSILGDSGIMERKFDMMAVNGDEMVVVEIRPVLTPKKVKRFLSELQQFKNYCPSFGYKRVFGAVAYLKSKMKADQLAENQGLFVIRVRGESTSIVNQKDFKPKEFPSIS